jgi:hexosaminidase
MTETLKKALGLLFLLTSVAIHAAAQPDLKLIPQPKTIQPAAGDCPLGSVLDIAIEDPVLKNEAAVLAVDLAPRLAHLESDARLKIALALTPAIDGAPAAAGQAYRLSAGADGIRIEGVDAEAVFYGTRTLLQIIDNQRAPSRIPALVITDWPDIRYRASQHDTRSQIMQTAALKRFIRGLADFKYGGRAHH